MVTRILFVASLAALAAPAQAPRPASADPLAGLDAHIERARGEFKIVGLAVGIVRNDSLIYAKGFGLKELGKPDSVTPRTLFAIGSNTKSFTATAAALLVDDGRVGWNDPVTKWLPGFQLFDPYVTREITIRDVLSHRSGLGRRGDALWYGTDYSRREILRRIRFLEPNAGFRTEMGYQNIMFLAAGEALGEAAGMSYDDLIRRRLFTPLGMTTSGLSVTELPSQRDVSTPHAIVDSVVKAIPWRNIDNIAPAGSINSNVVEMAQYLRLHLGDGVYRGTRLVSRQNLGQTKTPHINAGGVGDSLTHFTAYGLGWVLQDYRGKKIAWHNGGIDGMLSEMWTIPEAGLGIVVLTNTSPHAAGPAIVWNIIDRFLVGAPSKDYVAEALRQVRQAESAQRAQTARRESQRLKDTKPSLPLDRYAGTYVDSLYGEVTIEHGADGLAARWQSMRERLQHWHLDLFRVEPGSSFSGMLTFFVGSEGQVTAVDLEGMGRFGRKPGAGR
jgi:CubicO group peptidase (beta-lactamase class C family)